MKKNHLLGFIYQNRYLSIGLPHGLKVPKLKGLEQSF